MDIVIFILGWVFGAGTTAVLYLQAKREFKK